MCRGKFYLKINKRADQNKAVQRGFFLKINKRTCMSIGYTRVCMTPILQTKVKLKMSVIPKIVTDEQHQLKYDRSLVENFNEHKIEHKQDKTLFYFLLSLWES